MEQDSNSKLRRWAINLPRLELELLHVELTMKGFMNSIFSYKKKVVEQYLSKALSSMETLIWVGKANFY